MIDRIMTSNQFVKGRVQNGHVKNGHTLKNSKKICNGGDFDMNEYVAVGIHEAQPTSSSKINDVAIKLATNPRHMNIKEEKSETSFR